MGTFGQWSLGTFGQWSLETRIRNGPNEWPSSPENKGVGPSPADPRHSPCTAIGLYCSLGPSTGQGRHTASHAARGGGGGFQKHSPHPRPPTQSTQLQTRKTTPTTQGHPHKAYRARKATPTTQGHPHKEHKTRKTTSTSHSHCTKHTRPAKRGPYHS